VIVPTRPQLLPKPGETSLEVGQAESSRTRMKNGNGLVPTKTDLGKQRYTKPTTHRRLSGTADKRVRQGVRNTGVRYTGQNEDVSDGYSRIAEQRAPKPHGMLGDTNSHSDLYGTFSPTGFYTMRSLIRLETNDKDMVLDSNNMGTNRISTISTSSTIDHNHS
jgi:hypothetical protein